MAIANSYPHAVPTITDTVIGTKYVENQEPSTKSFSIGDIVDLVPVVNPNPTYKVYTALLTQTGTNAPVATVLENTLGVTPTWLYGVAGSYTTDQVLGQNSNKIYYNITNKGNVLNEFRISLAQNGPNFGIAITTYDSGVNTNGLLSKVPIEIRVYN